MSADYPTSESYEYQASDFDGVTGGAMIQAAIDVANDEQEHSIVVVGPTGPDDGRWLIEETLVLPSHTTLVLRSAQLKLANAVGDNIIRNEAATAPEDVRDEDIHILGIGDAHIDGNGAAQHGVVVPIDADQHAGNREYDYFRRNGIDLYKVDDFSVQGFAIGPTNAYAIAPEDVTNGYISDITYRMDGTTQNQDAVNLGGPAEDILMENLRGTLSDGAITISSRGTATSHKTVLEGGDVRNIYVRDCHFENVKGKELRWTGDGYEETGRERYMMAILHTWPHSESTLEHIRVSNVSGRNMVSAAYRTGGEYVKDDRPFTETSLHKDIVIDGLYAHGSAMCEFFCDVSDLTIRNAYAEGSPRHGTACLLDDNGYEADGLRLDNCVAVPPADHGATAAVNIEGTIPFGKFTDVTVRGGRTNEPLTALHLNDDADVGTLGVSNLRIEDVAEGIRIDEGASFGRVRVEEAQFDRVDTEWELADPTGLVVNGIGREVSSEGFPSTNRWATGDVVECVDGEGNSLGVYVFGRNDTWLQLGDETA